MRVNAVGCSVEDEQRVAKDLHCLTSGVHWEHDAGWEVRAESCTIPKYTALLYASARAMFPPMSEVDAQSLAVDVWEKARERMPGVQLNIGVEASDGAWAFRS